MRVCTIASGSSGNCIYVGSSNTHLLVDAGISCKRIIQGVEDAGVKSTELNGVFFFPVMYRQIAIRAAQMASQIKW